MTIVLLASGTLVAQTQILGLVTDPAGAVILRATVTARRVATGDVRTTQTNETGNYIFPLLEVGDYEVTCAAPGFRTDVRRGIVLELQQKLRLDFQMQIGQQAQTVEVSGAAPLLRTEDATLGSVVEERRLLGLPTNGRNFAQVATLMPGVVYGTARMGIDGQGTQGTRAMPGQAVGLSANGQRDNNQNVTLDGVSAVDGFKNMMLFVPSIEAVEEFKVQSAVYSAEFGMNSGAQASVVIKSGTNQIHGTAFEFLRNNDMDARNFFLPAPLLKNILHRNQFGGVASGPIKKDKTFWLFNYEGRREIRGNATQTSVPTLAMRAGDFSEILQPGNRYYPTTNVANLLIRYPGNSAPFSNNIIPPSMIDPVSQNILTSKLTSPFPQGGFMPFPNNDAQAKAAKSTLNLVGTDRQIMNSDSYLGRFDHKIGDNDRVFARYVLVKSAWTVDRLVKVTSYVTDYFNQNLAIGYTKILRPTILNELRFGYNRIHYSTLNPQTNTDFTQQALGLNFTVNGRPLTKQEECLPSISITGFTGIGCVGNQPVFHLNKLYDASDNVTINWGKHNFKFGAEYIYAPVNTAQALSFTAGQLSFTRNIAGIPDAFAAFMLGIPLSANSAEGNPPNQMRQQRWGLYWLDDYKATSKLTINFGIRWDWYGHWTDALGRIRTLSLANADVQTVNGQVYPELVPGPGVSKGLYDINWKQFMPRLGLAYRINNTTVIRSGSGLFYSPQIGNNFSNLGSNPPYSGSTLFQNDVNNPTATIENPFAGTAQGGPAALVMLGYQQADRGNRSMYLNNKIWQWTMELEETFGHNLVAGLAYVGSASSNIDMGLTNWNNPDPGLGAVQSRRPIQYYVDVQQPGALLPLGTVKALESWTSANYNSLQLRAEQRYAHGLTFHASFNYQRANSIGYSVNEDAAYGPRSLQNPNDRKADYGRSNIDQRLRFVFSHVWEIPWLRNAKGSKNRILGGWAINGIITLQSGLPVTVGQSGDSQNTGSGGSQRPNIVFGQKVDRVMANRSLAQWFNTAAFVQSKCNGCPGAGTFMPPLGYGNAGVALFDAPATKTWDFALLREFKIREGHTVEFRWETFNFLNTPQFAAPARSLGVANFGQISSTALNNREMQFGLKYRF